jgi:hypothetical protein
MAAVSVVDAEAVTAALERTVVRSFRSSLGECFG